MPRFFFHFQGKKELDDREGVELRDLKEAIRYAKEIAGEYARNKRAAVVAEDAIRVTDETGQEVHRFPLV